MPKFKVEVYLDASKMDHTIEGALSSGYLGTMSDPPSNIINPSFKDFGSSW